MFKFDLIPPVKAQGFNLSNEYGFGQISSLGDAFGYLIGPGFAIAGTAVVFYLLIGAVRYIISGGDKAKVEGARAMMTHAIIGLILLIMLFLVIEFLPGLLNLGSYRIVK